MRLLGVLAVLSLALGSLAADKSGPEISKKKFPAPPVNLFYFDDSETVLVLEPENQIVYISKDAGEEWDKVDDIPKGHVAAIYPNPYDPNVAVAIGMKKSHWITYDQGKKWREFKTKDHPTGDRGMDALGFHATDNKRILFHAQEDCLIFGLCVGKSYYTTNGFEDSSMSLVHARRKMCMWVKSHPLFTTGDKKKDDNSILCIVEGKFSPLMKDYRLVVSDDLFETEREPTMGNAREVRGFANMAAVKGYLVAAAKAAGTRELALYVSTDAQIWHRAEFGDHKIEEDAYTILESTNYSIQVDVMTQRHTNMGTLFSSNSNGTYFSRNIEHTNRNGQGIVDFEKIQNIQGIVLVNSVENWEEIAQPLSMATKKIKSKISFDDGRTFEGLRAGEDELQLHSVTQQHNSGRIFSSAAPGIVMGIGNTGKYLDTYNKGSLFVSRDAGRTWIDSKLKGPQKYEFLDQGSVLVAIAEELTDEVSYSLDQGHSWETVKLPDSQIVPLELTTIPDSTSLRCLLVGKAKGTDEYLTFTLDFDSLHKKKCEDGDFEKWYARTDDDSKPTCVMGHKQWFTRRKSDATCFVKQLTKEFLPQSEPCDCTDADFECDTNFVRTSDGKCEAAGKIPMPDGACKNPDDSFKGGSGWRLIPGNDCKRTGGAQKDDGGVDRPCKDAVGTPADGKVKSNIHEFPGTNFRQTFYLERDPKASGTDETVVVLNNQRKAWISHDHGKTWKQVRQDDEIVAIYPHQYNNDYVYFITPSRTVYYSENRGQAIHSFTAPDVPDPERQILAFHQKNPEWLLWVGDKDCMHGNTQDCHTVAHVSKKNGVDWMTLLRYIEKCQFMYREGRQSSEELVYCEQYQDEDKRKPLQLLASEDFFDHKPDILFTDVVNFATMSEFIVVAAKTEDRKWLKVDASIDGKTFAPAAFPTNFQVDHQQAYTVLDSSTNAVFLHVTVNGDEGREYGTILKSNSNGTSYVLSIRQVNRNKIGYVDFEKMQGLEGVALVNQVANYEDVDNGAPKKLQTKITHNDGADWALLPPPAKGKDGKPYDCAGKGIKECSLHLHGYTERKDPRDTFSSPSAVGLMLGIGNVGDHLTEYNEGNTFLTTDGGITWKETMKGTYMWEYGDQGSVIVMVERGAPTKRVLYTTDEGKTWKEHEFSDQSMIVDRITTVPSDNSRNFLLWGKLGASLATVNIDFTGLTDKQCNLDKAHLDDDKSDYELWRPAHPLKQEEPDCLFGHVAEYYRKKPDRMCYNGPLIDRLHDVARNCSCTRSDFECGYNFERQEDGSCVLAPNLTPLSGQEVCKNDPTAVEWFKPSGYRKIPISTCSGGLEMDEIGDPSPCPGHEEEFQKKRGMSGIGLFFAIVIPFAAAGGIGYWFFRNWDGKFGAIRLGESSGGSFGDSPWVAWPVAALSALVAVAAALPLLVGSLWRSARSMFGGYGGRTYTSRDSFARGRGDYAVVDNDEGELLGDDSDEEV